MENRIPPRFSLLYLRKKQTDNLINMQNLTTQCHSKKVLRTVKYCVSKESVQQTEFECYCKGLQEQFTKRGYDSSSIETKINKIKFPDTKDLLTPKTTKKAQVLPLTVTYNRRLPNIKQIIQNHWSILKTNKALVKTFPVEPIIAFCKNKSLKQLIGGNTIQNDKNIKISSNKYEGKCTPYKSGIGLLFCLHVQNTHSFPSDKKWTDIYHFPFVIYTYNM